MFYAQGDGSLHSAQTSNQTHRRPGRAQVNLDEFQRFALDFNIIPQLMQRKQLGDVFNDVASMLHHRAPTGGGAAAAAAAANDAAKHGPRISFTAFLLVLGKLAAAAFDGVEDEEGMPATSDRQVLALLQWMDNSTGKEKIRRSGVCQKAIPLFRVAGTPRDSA